MHRDAKYWPLPVGPGVLVELEAERLDLHIELLGGNVRNRPVGVVRAVSPDLPERVRRMLMPEGEEPGGVGVRVLVAEPHLRYLRESEYEICGLELPSQEGDVGDLAFIDYERIIAVMKPGDALPFEPLGARVFFAFDYDDESGEFVERGGVLVPERALARENQLATVIAVGPEVRLVRVGDRVIAPMGCAMVELDSQRYTYVNHERELIAILRPAHEQSS